jgi:hypothetical protein
MPIPVNKELYDQVKRMANEVFDSKSGIYRSVWIVRKYKELGGKYKPDKKPKQSGILRWLKEAWIDLNQPKKNGGYERCGKPNTINPNLYPLCRPSVRVSPKTPKRYQDISEDRIKEVNKLKQRYKWHKNINF